MAKYKNPIFEYGHDESVLIIPTPRNCGECWLRFKTEDMPDGKVWCPLINQLTDAQERNEYCMLRPVVNSDAYYIGHHDGIVDGCDRQKPMEPEMDRSLSEIKQEPILRCPNCGTVLDCDIDEHDYNYCYNCGQALDWTE